jgi:hypothetical protein
MTIAMRLFPFCLAVYGHSMNDFVAIPVAFKFNVHRAQTCTSSLGRGVVLLYFLRHHRQISAVKLSVVGCSWERVTIIVAEAATVVEGMKSHSGGDVSRGKTKTRWVTQIFKVRVSTHG